MAKKYNPLLAFGFTDKVVEDYRSNTLEIDGETEIVFSKEFESLDYFIQVLSYEAADGTIITGGFTITNKTVTGFTFTPPGNYASGSLIYRAELKK